MLQLRTITFHYDPQQDRILAVINVGQEESWSCWLTRRMTVAAIAQVGRLVERTSELGKKANPEFRSDMLAFEKDAALVNTAKAVTLTPKASVKASASTTECAKRFSVTHVRQKFLLELEGASGEVAKALIARSVFQRVLRALEDEVAKADWLVDTGRDPGKQPPPSAATPRMVRH